MNSPSPSHSTVALESTLIAHGIFYPENLQLARDLELIIREEGAFPATIAVIRGQLRVGLTDEELELIAHPSPEETVHKLSRRDLGIALAQGLTGATTVASTMIGAHRSGIQVFATGGIGGVHRGVEETWDISADLQELARTPVIVVCSGAKSILDIPKTLEVLETLGVPVLGYQTRQFPAFYLRDSGETLEYAVHSPEEIAEIALSHWSLGFQSGLLVVNPIPEGEELDQQEHDRALQLALDLAKEEGICGKALTPFLLRALMESTEGKSLRANLALVKSNARLAAQIALCLREKESLKQG